jgi:molybdenum storage protein
MSKHHQRFELENRLQGESLVRRGLLSQHRQDHQLRLLPNLNVIKIGGHGIIDYGREVLMPLIEEIGTLSADHQILVVTGGGVRVRHILDVGLDLGMPTGVLAELAGKVSEQNSILLAILLSQYHGVRIHTGDLLELPMLLSLGVIPVMHGTPPYGLYEYPGEYGSAVPPHRTDTGAFLIAEVLGARRCILVKDVDGLHTQNPKEVQDAPLIQEITARELLDRDMEDLVLERKTVELLANARSINEIWIVNGHRSGSISAAIRGENRGTVIKAR